MTELEKITGIEDGTMTTLSAEDVTDLKRHKDREERIQAIVTAFRDMNASYAERYAFMLEAARLGVFE